MPFIQSEMTARFVLSNHKWRPRGKPKARLMTSLAHFKYVRSSMTDDAQYGHVWSYKLTTPWLLPRIPFITNNIPVEFMTLQFPLKVFFAMTILTSLKGKLLKSQELTWGKAVSLTGSFKLCVCVVSSPEVWLFCHHPPKWLRSLFIKKYCSIL